MLDASHELRDQLLSSGLLSATEVAKAELEAAEKSCDFETVLRKKKVFTDSQLHALRAQRLNVPFADLSDFIPRMQNSELVTEELARRHVMFPLFDLDNVITLVMDNPSDLAGIDQVRRTSKREVEICLGAKGDILGLIERAYGSSKYLEEFSVSDSLKKVEVESTSDDSQPVIRLVRDLINEAVRQGASDIHIEPGEKELRIRIRVDGVLREIAAPPLALHRALVSRIKILAKLDISLTRSPQDGAFDHKHNEIEVVLRVSMLPSIWGEAAVLRILRNESESITLNELGMTSNILKRFQGVIQNAHGMILVSGPTGSGKSTTLYAAMKCVACPQKNIIAIEDPVEYRTSIIRQVQVNKDANLTFASGLRSVLRQDPDVIMVGEIRDTETAQIAVQAALTGHLVLSTVHTNDSISAISRFRDLGVPEYLISASFLAVLAQRLCRRVCPDCKSPDSPPKHMFEALGLDPSKVDFEPMKGKGCRRCIGTGYVGRVGVYELFEINDRSSQMIVRNEPSESIRIAAKAEGMRFLVDDGIDKIRAGATTMEEVVRIAGRC
ncbi:MAG: type II/IV secretion system protein [Planctomycetes bacterium]|nr:type II/IV secretion system protein [Planctomycetota bacterium]